MSKNIHSLFNIAIILATLIFTSCTTKINIDDLGDANLNQSITLPIGKISTNINDVVTMAEVDEYLSIDTNQVDNSMTYYIGWELDDQHVSIMEYIGDFTTGAISNTELKIYELPEVTAIFNSLPPSVSTIKLPQNSYEVNKAATYDFGFNVDTETEKIRVDLIHIKESTIDINFNVEDIVLSATNYILFEITIPMLENKYSSFTTKITSENTTFSKILNDFNARFSNNLSTTDIYYKYTIVSDGNMEVGRNAKVNIDTQFRLIDYSLMQGYYWKEKPLYDNVYSFDIPSMLSSQSLAFTNPSISVHLANNIGATAELTFNSMSAINENGDTQYAEFGNGETSTTITINKPNTPGEYATTDILFNNEYGSIGTLLKNNPTKMEVDMTLRLAKEANESNFLINPDSILMDADLYLPLQFDEETKMILHDTLEVDFSYIEEYTEYIEEFYVMINAENSIPVKLNTTLSFTDENYNELFKHSDITILAPDVDAEGKSTTAANSKINAEFDPYQIENIGKTAYIIVDASLTGKDDESKIFLQPTDSIGLKLSAFAKFNATFDINEILNGSSNE